MSQPRPGDEIVQRIVNGDAPLNLRSAAARGALPLPPDALARLYVYLLGDEDAGVKQGAGESLGNLKEGEIHEILAEPACHVSVLDHFAKRAASEEGLAEKIAFHPQVGSQALSILASAGNASVIDLVLTNQETLLEQPALLETLMGNPALRPGQQARILELLDRAMQLKAKAEAEEAPEGEEAEEIVEEELNAEDLARMLDVDVGELLTASEILGGEELEYSEDPQVRSAYKIICTLNTAQKAILALKGGREERMILIRDSNKVVAMGVLKNARINVQEVEAIARMRNVTDEVLRYVGSNRDWVRSYEVIHSLVTNPKTPQNISANFIPRLSNRDLKNLTGSRDVPELIRRMARRTHDLRTQKQSNRFGKK